MHTTKDLASLLQILQTSRASGELWVTPLELEQNKVPWQGRLQLLDGHINACQVQNMLNRQVLLRNEEALQWLMNSQHGKLEWSLGEDNPSPTGQFLSLLPTPSGEMGVVPRRTGPLNITPSSPQQNRNTPNPYRDPVPQQNRNTPNPYRDPVPQQNRNTPNPYQHPVPQQNRNTPNPYQNPMPQQNSYQDIVPQQNSYKDELRRVFKRTEYGKYQSGNTLPSREHRQVFSLIDGARTVSEIASLVHKAPDQILRIVEDLCGMKFIE